MSSLEGLMRLATQALIEVSRRMRGIELCATGEPIRYSNSLNLPFECGACVGLQNGPKAWSLALFGKQRDCESLARSVLRIGSRSQPSEADVADALGEILNMVAGVAKRQVGPLEASDMTIGLPMYFQGQNCFRFISNGIGVLCQRLAGPEVEVSLIVAAHEEDA